MLLGASDPIFERGAELVKNIKENERKAGLRLGRELLEASGHGLEDHVSGTQMLTASCLAVSRHCLEPKRISRRSNHTKQLCIDCARSARAVFAGPATFKSSVMLETC